MSENNINGITGAEVTTTGIIGATVAIGKYIINDYVITIAQAEDEYGYTMTITRGTDTQTVTLYGLTPEQYTSMLGYLQQALTAATNAQTAAQEALTAAQSASTSASSASTDATTASQAASQAASSASSASQSASAASGSATSAATSASSASASATSAQTAQTAAETAQTAAESAASNASTAATNAATSASQAAQSATDAAGSVSAAAQTLTQVQSEGAAQIAAIGAEGERVMESIPADYTALEGEVTELKSATNIGIKNVSDYVGFPFKQQNLLLGVAMTDHNRIDITNGNLNGNPSLTCYATDFIPVSQNSNYTLNYSYYSSGNYGMGFYYEDKTFIIGSGIKQGTTNSASTPFTFTVPPTAKYVRVSIPYDVIPLEDAYLYEGEPEVNPYYVPYTDVKYTNDRIDTNGDMTASDTHFAYQISLENVLMVRAKTSRQSGAGGWTIAFYSSDTPSASSFIEGKDAINSTMVTAEGTYSIPTNAKVCVIVSRYRPPVVQLGYSVKGFILKELDKLYDKKTTYAGERINLRNELGIQEIGRDVIKAYVSSSVSETGLNLSGQAIAIYGNELFRFHDKGYCRVYDISDLSNVSFVRHFNLDGYGPSLHCNCATFAPSVENGETYPYIYVAKYTSMECYVEKLTDSGAVLIQTITIDNTVTTRPHGNIWIGDDGYLYACTAPTGSDPDISTPANFTFYKFRTPDLNNSEVVLSEPDVIETWKMENYVYNSLPFQGAMTCNGKVFVAFGISTTDRIINVWDDKTHKLVSTIPITENISHEPEDVAVYNGDMILAVNGANVAYRLIF